MQFKESAYRITLYLLWIIINFAVFLDCFYKYYDRDEFLYLRMLTGISIPIARASAACLNLNCAFVLVPICRHAITWIRAKLAKSCSKNITRILDETLHIHKLIASIVILFSLIHYFAHCSNFEKFARSYESDAKNHSLLVVLSSLTNSPNPILHRNENPVISLLKSTPGLTGVLMSICLILIFASSMEYVRQSNFEIFWFTHHLFFIFYIALMIHGTGGLVKRQINLAEHNPHVCMYKIDDWDQPKGCPLPRFKAVSAESYIYILPSFLIYLIFERLIRTYWRYQKAIVTKIINHPSNVLELQMKRKHFSMKPGQYVFIHCQKASFFEWHPFTLTSAPDDIYFSVHIRAVGDWTRKVSQLFINDSNANENLPDISIDGPFGAPAEDALKYETVILVGAGIGVTPFASLLRHINSTLKSSSEMKLKKIYFYWICNDIQCFEWFVELLAEMEHQLNAQGNQDMLNHNIYLTRGWNSNQAANIMLNENNVSDSITGLSKKTCFGRPNWDAIFEEIATNQGGSVGVFCCGPMELANTLQNKSNHYSDSVKGITFYFNKECF